VMSRSSETENGEEVCEQGGGTCYGTSYSRRTSSSAQTINDATSLGQGPMNLTGRDTRPFLPEDLCDLRREN
jgi:hypothetical protein